MKKLILSLVLAMSLVGAVAGMVTFRWNPANAPLRNGQPPVQIKMYYGSALGVYTNSVVADITTNLTTTPYAGVDQYDCVPSIVSNYISIPIYGLTVSNQIFTAYTFIYADGVETPFIKEATCGFTITNKNDKPIVPKNLRQNP